MKRSRGDDDAAGVTDAADMDDTSIPDGASSVADETAGGSRGGVSHKRGKVAGGRAPGCFDCEASCGRRFSASGGLANHIRMHTGEKPHVCETCGKAFAQSSDLTKHMRIHSGEKPHVCETCGEAFACSGTLASHLRTHTGEKPHVCDTCGEAFSKSDRKSVV